MANNDNSESYQAITVFCQKYDPADHTSMTDKFTSLEIQQIVYNHVGVKIELGELHNLMNDMKFIYELEDDQFVWLCQKA